jgi:preprotein translocase subunit YajC
MTFRGLTSITINMLELPQLMFLDRLFIAQAPAAEGVGGFIQQFLGNPINLILFSLILFMLLVIRPQRREMKRHQQLLANLKKNDRVITSGGIHGVVVQAGTGEPTISIRVDENSGTRMTINRDSVATILGSGSDSTK